MAVTFQLPTDLEKDLRHDLKDLDAQAKEALLVALYRQGKLSHHALSQALWLDRCGTEDVLLKHNVTEDLGTVDEHLAEVRSIEGLRAKPSLGERLLSRLNGPAASEMTAADWKHMRQELLKRVATRRGKR